MWKTIALVSETLTIVVRDIVEKKNRDLKLIKLMQCVQTGTFTVDNKISFPTLRDPSATDSLVQFIL